tara:strand:+ start:525 stop:719 length:195 start_codon:yes stop_codon:yes gene_type:complete
MKETATQQVLSKQLDLLLEIKDLKETNEQLDGALVKAYDDIESLGTQIDNLVYIIDTMKINTNK